MYTRHSEPNDTTLVTDDTDVDATLPEVLCLNSETSDESKEKNPKIEAGFGAHDTYLLCTLMAEETE